MRPYRDKLPRGDNHLKYHSFSLRARLEQANGTSANDVLIVGAQADDRKMEDYAIGKMDEWLTAVAQDTSSESLATKIFHDKPSDIEDACWAPGGERIAEQQTFTGGKCNDFYPTAPSPRMVAGESVLGNNILKCQLKPVSPSDYKVTFTGEQMAALRAIFPQGVCDYSKPGVEQQPPTIGNWHAF